MDAHDDSKEDLVLGVRDDGREFRPWRHAGCSASESPGTDGQAMGVFSAFATSVVALLVALFAALGWRQARREEAARPSPPAWHPDPTGAATWRWWDGSRWTEHTA